MTVAIEKRGNGRGWFSEYILLGQTVGEYIRSLITPFNFVVAAIFAAGGYAAYLRYFQGLAAATNLSNTYPWGLWIGFDVMSGVALAAGGYTLATTVYIFRLKEYYPLVRPAILTGLLGYILVAVGLLFDIGRPWRLPYPIGVSFGMTSVMFSVAWHLFLYLCFLFIEFLPAVFEWLHWGKMRRLAVRLTLWATILGVMLSTLHQAALGGLFLLSPNKVHPLWYSPLLPLFFLVSSSFAGVTMVIVECTVSHKFLHKICDRSGVKDLNRLVLGLSKAAALIMFVYFGLKVMGVMHANAVAELATPYGAWFLVELLGFVLLPSVLFLWAGYERAVNLARLAAVIAVAGIVVNRLNISFIAYNWQLPERYFPAWSEFAVTLAIVTAGVVGFRWVVNRMPVLYEHPEYRGEH